MIQRIAIVMLVLAWAVTHARVGCAQSAIAIRPEGQRDWSARFVYRAADARLAYDRTDRGDRIPDFSVCGYRGGGVVIPAVPAVLQVSPSGGDEGPRIQAAIDRVSSWPVNSDGFRGAVVLTKGNFPISGSIVLHTDGVVLRGSGSFAGDPADRTVLLATGLGRRSLVRIEGRGRAVQTATEPMPLADGYVPCGAGEITLAGEHDFQPGELVCIEHPGTAAWIHGVGMDRFPTRDRGSWLDWRPNTINIRWLRTVASVDGRRITVDAPLTCGIDSRLTAAVVRRCDPRQFVQNVGVENLICVARVTGENPKDEDHAWNGVSFNHVQDGWAQNLEFRGFCGSAVLVLDDCRRISVVDCRSVAPISEVAGWRRHTFFTNGQQTLFLRCRAEDGRHDFAVGHAAPGPNAFSYCESVRSTEFSGPIGSWASGVLFDNVTIDGAPLALTNRETEAQGTGWSAANCVLWNCVAPAVVCRMPPNAQNWAIGVWGEFVGDGYWRQLNEFVEPDSLLVAQLTDRLGSDATSSLGRQLPPAGPCDAPAFVEPAATTFGEAPASSARSASHLRLEGGQLRIQGTLAAGKRIGTQWWRGSVLPDRASEFAPGVTRFVPGRIGRGFTDDLDQLTDDMQRAGVLVLEHHWGLWYDRRRDDHQIVRRINGAVWPPFYEQPWARSGIGTSWDGLSRYDLTKFNPWYFSRLRDFVGHCDRKGLVLMAHMYFQHNLLEAGAHWVDFPWRTTNCLQDTGFPEPPPLENRKRVSLANEFWDVTHPVRRNLHELYIRHYLDQLGSFHNVIFTTGEEFTGPAEFVTFWLDTISAWQREKHRDVLVALSCTKDVQDGVLDSPAQESVVDIIDLKYWWYTPDGGLYAPRGGQQRAPRQQLREHPGSRARSPVLVARAVEEYRRKYPAKAVICSFPEVGSRHISSAGGSLPPSPADLSPIATSDLPTILE